MKLYFFDEKTKVHHHPNELSSSKIISSRNDKRMMRSVAAEKDRRKKAFSQVQIKKVAFYCCFFDYMCYLNDNNDRNRNLPVPSYSLSVFPPAELMGRDLFAGTEYPVEIGQVTEAGQTGSFRHGQSGVFQ